ncbi:class F sortase [Candidatus Microgenomates bacterium]|nr:MAG: class F sortase [Candidatus Microgenomates bacterium]
MLKMKKILLISFIVLMASVGWWLGLRSDIQLVSFAKSQNKVVSPISRQQSSPLTMPTAEPAVAVDPYRLKIAKLGIDTEIEYVGLDEKQNMDVPKDDMNVGWYELGAKPGSLGKAVIAGHFDTRSGTPAVFYELDDLEAGDEVIVESEQGEQLTFAVMSKSSYPTNEFPIDIVFGPAEESQLNLITCAGVFDTSKQSYSNRTVVFTKLKEI